MNLDDIFFKSYLQEFSEKEKKKILTSQEDRIIANRKKIQLVPIGDFLQRFVDLEVTVNHCGQYTKNAKSSTVVEPQKFNFYWVDSSKSWSPGVSIFFDHPAEVEIAVPNNENDGVVIIKVASHHPDAYILEQHFSSQENACIALGKFLGRCTVSIGKNPSKYLNKDYKDTKKADMPSFIPDSPPNEMVQTKKTQDFFQKKDDNL